MATATIKPETKLKKAVAECKIMMDELKIPYNKGTTVTINSRAKRRWGVTNLNKKTQKYTIQIASRLLQDDVNEKSLKNTIMHEFLHTAPGCLNHGKTWTKYAEIINKKYQYNIQRVSGDKEGLDLIDENEYKYIFECSKCGQRFNYLRRPKWTDCCEKAKHEPCNAGLIRIK